jgi:hypothetical protein
VRAEHDLDRRRVLFERVVVREIRLAEELGPDQELLVEDANADRSAAGST